MVSGRRFVVGVLGILVLATLAGRAQESLPVPVFVEPLEIPVSPALRPEQHEALISAARTEMFDLAAKLRKQHGDKTTAWPPAVWKEFYVAEDAHLQAVARRDYQPRETRLLLADTVEDFLRGAKENKAITMVPTAEEAALVVQIIGRRRTSPPGPTDNRYFIRFRLGPGGKLTPQRFDDLTMGYKWYNLWSKTLAHPDTSSPYVELEAGSMASWKNCAGTVRAIVEGFVRQRVDPNRKK